MLTLDNIARMAAELPAVTEAQRHGNRTWFVAGAAFAWERPFSKADIRRFGGETPPDGPILAIRVADLGAKAAILEGSPTEFFTIPHFDGYAAVLVRLQSARKRPVRDALIQGWWSSAPAALTRQDIMAAPVPRRAPRGSAAP